MTKTDAEYYQFDPQDYLPRGCYPWPDLINPNVDQFEGEYCRWVDEGYGYLTSRQRELYKKMRLYRCTARMLPYADARSATPCYRFVLFHCVFDDQLEYATKRQVSDMRARLVDIFGGGQPARGELGLYHQAAKIRAEYLEFMPRSWMDRFTQSFHRIARYGVEDEMPYKAAKKTMSLAFYEINREYTVLMYPYLEMIEAEAGFLLSDDVYNHPLIQRLRVLTSRIVGWQNDIQGLNKELSLETETSNLVIVLQRERELSLQDALTAAMEIHDKDLAEFVALEKLLPEFGSCQRQVERYVLGLGTFIQGVNSFYLDTTRYLPGGAGFAWPSQEPSLS